MRFIDENAPVHDGKLILLVEFMRSDGNGPTWEIVVLVTFYDKWR